LLVIPRQDYEQVLVGLTLELPGHIRHRTLHEVRELSGAGASADVRLKEFQRGVQIIVLLEELCAMLEEFFVAIDIGQSGEVQLPVLLTALENAAEQSKQRALDEKSLAVLKHCLRPSDTNTSSSRTTDEPTESAHRCLGLSEIQDVVFRAIFSA
jgi:hypothetical protein